MKVRIVEKLSAVIEVESVEEAEKMYKNREVVLLSDDFKEVEFEEVRNEND